MECRDQIRHLQSNLQFSLAAVDVDEVVRQRLLFDYRRNVFRRLTLYAIGAFAFRRLSFRSEFKLRQTSS